MKPKEYLSRYHKMKVKIEKLQSLHGEYIRLSQTIPGCNFDDIRVDGTRNNEAPFVKWIHKALELEDDIKHLMRKLPIIKNEILDSISTLENPEYKRLLIFKYIDWLSWREIADKMHYSIATIRRWHEKVLIEIKVPKNMNMDEQP